MYRLTAYSGDLQIPFLAVDSAHLNYLFSLLMRNNCVLLLGIFLSFFDSSYVSILSYVFLYVLYILYVFQSDGLVKKKNDEERLSNMHSFHVFSRHFVTFIFFTYSSSEYLDNFRQQTSLKSGLK